MDPVSVHLRICTDAPLLSFPPLAHHTATMTAPPQSTADWRWFRHETRVWSLGYIVSTTPGVLSDETFYELWESTEESANSGVYRVKATATYPVDPTHLEDLADAARMNDLHEAPLLALLERRYNVGSIYTYTGDILISINPCVAYCSPLDGVPRSAPLSRLTALRGTST